MSFRKKTYINLLIEYGFFSSNDLKNKNASISYEAKKVELLNSSEGYYRMRLEPSIKSAYYHDCFFYEKTIKEWYEYVERSIFDDTLLAKTIIALYSEYGDIYEAFDSLINNTGYYVSVIFFNILKVIDFMSREYNTKWERFILKQIEKRNLQQSKNEVLVLPYEVVAFMVGRDSVGMNYRYNESSRYVYNI